MEIATEEYRGFTIAVMPIKDHGDLWDFEYRLSTAAGSGDDSAATFTRSKTSGGYNSAATACSAGLQVARTEIDNRLAMAGTSH